MLPKLSAARGASELIGAPWSQHQLEHTQSPSSARDVTDSSDSTEFEPAPPLTDYPLGRFELHRRVSNRCAANRFYGVRRVSNAAVSDGCPRIVRTVPELSLVVPTSSQRARTQVRVVSGPFLGLRHLAAMLASTRVAHHAQTKPPSTRARRERHQVSVPQRCRSHCFRARLFAHRAARRRPRTEWNGNFRSRGRCRRARRWRNFGWQLRGLTLC